MGDYSNTFFNKNTLRGMYQRFRKARGKMSKEEDIIKREFPPNMIECTLTRSQIISWTKKTHLRGWNEALQEMKKKIKSIRLSDFEDSLPQSLLLKDIEALKKEKQEGK